MARKRSVTVEFLAEDRDFQRGARRVGGTADEMEGKFQKFGRGVKAAVGVVAAGAVGSFALDAAKRGIAIETTMEKVGNVFGANAAEIELWAKDNRKSFGDSTAGVLEQAAAVQDLLVPLGFTREEATGLTKSVGELAAALADNAGPQIDFADASERVRKALLGERESLEALGVKVLQSEVNARLAAQGQDNLTGSVKAQAEAQATLAIITEKSTDALRAYRNGTNEALMAQKEMESNLAEFQDQVSLLAANAVPALGKINSAWEDVTDFLGHETPQALERVTQLLKDQSGQVQENALEIALASRDYGEFRRVLDKAGIGIEQVLHWANQGTEGFGRFASVNLELQQRMGNLSSGELRELRKGMEEIQQEVAAAKDEWLIHATAVGEAARDYMNWVTSAGGAAEAQGRMAEATRDATAAVHEQASPALAAINAARNLAEAVENVRRLQAEGKQGSDEYQAALLRLVEAQGRASAAGRAYRDEGGAASIDALRDLARLAGLSGQEINDLIGAIGRLNATSIRPKAARVVTTSSGFKLETFDHGGVVPGPRGQPRVIVAHGGETVLPTHKSNGGGLGNVTVNVTAAPGMNEQALARHIRDELVRLGRRNGGRMF